MPALTAGLGLKAGHHAQALACRSEGLWFEVHAENHVGDGGPRLAWLEQVVERHPLSLHGVSLSLAGTDPLDRQALGRLAALVRRLQPALVSEHLAWSRRDGDYFADLLPFPRSDAALAHVASRVDQVQAALGRTIAVENPSHYLRLEGHEHDEIGFLDELSRRTGCTLLLDLNNVFVSAANLAGSSEHAAEHYVDAFPADRVSEIHLAGHRTDVRPGSALLIDSHDAPVAAPVWALLERFLARAGPRPVLIERDAELPAFEVLLAERDRAHRLLTAKVTAPA